MRTTLGPAIRLPPRYAPAVRRRLGHRGTIRSSALRRVPKRRLTSRRLTVLRRIDPRSTPII
ncbi:hypothetical protein AB0M02_06380 [Actinoplanes sp. NPDC051861]|uniref:hypothetical protein n=1 Tax=Actinoplanes sp. NPDC051861 TaxID=3155170 RepID=UPI00341C465B